MALAYESAFDLAIEARVFQRATVAAVRAALDVYADAQAGAAAKQLATAVVSAPDVYGRLFAWVVVADAQFTTQSSARQASDATILAIVKAAWNAVAGA